MRAISEEVSPLRIRRGGSRNDTELLPAIRVSIVLAGFLYMIALAGSSSIKEFHNQDTPLIFKVGLPAVTVSSSSSRSGTAWWCCACTAKNARRERRASPDLACIATTDRRLARVRFGPMITRRR